MKAELIDVSECKKNLDIEIPQEVVDEEISHIAQEFARTRASAGIPAGQGARRRGQDTIPRRNRFRDDAAPPAEIFRRCGRGAETGNRATLRISSPSITHRESRCKFKAVFEVYPQLNVTNYDGIPVEAGFYQPSKRPKIDAIAEAASGRHGGTCSGRRRPSSAGR